MRQSKKHSTSVRMSVQRLEYRVRGVHSVGRRVRGKRPVSLLRGGRRTWMLPNDIPEMAEHNSASDRESKTHQE